MDAGRSGPSRRTGYRVVTRRAPYRIARIMEHWAEHPKLPQSFVNQYVWGHKTGDLPDGFRPHQIRCRDSKQVISTDGARIMVWGGKVLVLSGYGMLIRLRDDNRWEWLGSGAATADIGWGRTFARFGCEAVKEYSETEKRWIPRGTLPGAETFLPGPGGVFALADLTLYRLTGDREWVPVKRGVRSAALSRGLNEAQVFVAGTPTTGGRIERSSDKTPAWTTLRGRGFRDVFATTSRVYGLDRFGLVRFTENGYKRIHGEGEIFPHREGFFRLVPGGGIEEYDEGRRSWRTRGSAGFMLSLSVDPVTGTFHALKYDGKVATLSDTRSWEVLASLPRADDVLNLKKRK